MSNIVYYLIVGAIIGFTVGTLGLDTKYGILLGIVLGIIAGILNGILF